MANPWKDCLFLLCVVGVVFVEAQQLTPVTTEPTKFRFETTLPATIRANNPIPVRVVAVDNSGNIDTSYQGGAHLVATTIKTPAQEFYRDGFNNLNFTNTFWKIIGSTVQGILFDAKNSPNPCTFGSQDCVGVIGTTNDNPALGIQDGLILKFPTNFQPARISFKAKVANCATECLTFGPAIGITNVVYAPVNMVANPSSISILNCDAISCTFGLKSVNLVINAPYKIDLVFDWTARSMALFVNDSLVDTINHGQPRMDNFLLFGSVSNSTNFIDDFVVVTKELTFGPVVLDSVPPIAAFSSGVFNGNVQFSAGNAFNGAIDATSPSLSEMFFVAQDIANNGKGISTAEASVLPPCSFQVAADNDCVADNRVAIGAGAGGGAALIGIIIGIIVVVVLVRRRNRNKDKEMTHISLSKDQFTSALENGRVPGFSRYKIPVNIVGNSANTISYQDLKVDNPRKLLGRGGFGFVYLANYKGQQVAVKEINGEWIQESEVEIFVKESELMKNMKQHPNVIQFIGICSDPFCIVTEFMSKGDLWTYLSGTEKVTMLDCLSWIRNICDGMVFLSSQGIIHRDLAARNILLDASKVAKISDFGLSRLGNESKVVYSKSDIGPLKWMAPEAVQKKKYSEKSDVWAFGICCSEILNREEPYPQCDAVQAATLVVTEQLRVTLPDFTPPPLKDIILWCFGATAEERPTFSEISHQLSLMKF